MITQLASKFTKRYGNHWVSKEQYLQKVGCPYRRINLLEANYCKHPVYFLGHSEAADKHACDSCPNTRTWP